MSISLLEWLTPKPRGQIRSRDRIVPFMETAHRMNAIPHNERLNAPGHNRYISPGTGQNAVSLWYPSIALRPVKRYLWHW